MNFFTGYLLIINALGLIFMLADKLCAINYCWRIPEATLLGIGFIGGSLGCMIGMFLFRHKIRKPKFSLGLPAMVAVHTVLYIIIT